LFFDKLFAFVLLRHLVPGGGLSGAPLSGQSLLLLGLRLFSFQLEISFYNVALHQNSGLTHPSIDGVNEEINL